MFEQTIALIEKELGMTPEEGKEVEFNKEVLEIELDLLKNIKVSVLEMEVADEDQVVDPIDTFKTQPNILFFKDEEAGFLNAAIQSKKLIDQLINLNVPMGGNAGFDMAQMFANMMHNGEESESENADVIESENSDESESKVDTVDEAEGEK